MRAVVVPSPGFAVLLRRITGLAKFPKIILLCIQPAAIGGECNKIRGGSFIQIRKHSTTGILSIWIIPFSDTVYISIHHSIYLYCVNLYKKIYIQTILPNILGALLL